MANITLLGASYTDVPAVDLPQTGGGTVRFYENGGGSATLITKSITANGTYSAGDDSADGYSSVTVNVPSSAASSWTKIAETSYTVSTTSTSVETVATWATGHSEIWQSDKIVYVRVIDTAGKRTKYFYGTEQYFYLQYSKNGQTTTSSINAIRFTKYVVNNLYQLRYSTGTTGYGVYVDTVYANGDVRVRKVYDRTYAPTVNGTYKVEVYLLEPAGGVPIFE